MDELFECMSDKNIANILIFEQFGDEEYDTEAIKLDIFENENDETQSNICQWLHNNIEFRLIYQYIYHKKRMFSCYTL